MSQFIEMFGNQNTNDKGWTESLVKDEFKLSMGKTPARNNPECWDNGTHKWVSISDMSSYTRYTGDTSEYITDYAIADSGIKAVPKGTIIMSFKLSIGRTAITSEDLYTNEAIMAFAGFDEKKFNIDFLHFLIANKNWLLGAKQAVKGQTLNKESIGNAKIIIPPIEAQEEFASIYNQADKSEFVGCKSQFIEMFKEKGYPLRMLKSFADVSTGGTPSKANLEYWNGDKPWVSAEDMKNKYVYDTCEKVTEAGYATCKIIPVDTLMYVCRGSIGVMAINKIECATNQSICRAKCHDNVCNVEFLYHALMYQKDNIKKMGTGTSFKSLNQTSFSELKIELPPYNEQMKFVSIAQQADKSEFVGCKSQFIEMFGNQNTNDKGWTESLVKDEFKLSMGKTPARNNPECWDNGTHKWVSISDMSSYTRYTGDTSEYITDYAIADSGIKAVPKGTIIMSFKLSIGRTAITSEDLYTNEAIMAFAGFDEKKFNIDFLHFLIANKNWLLGAKQAVKGQTLNKESIGNAKIIIPPIEAQEEFASIYNQADKSEFVGCKSQFIEMFKEKGYPLRMLKSFADVSTGGTPSKANLEYWNGDKPWVSAEDMKNKYVYDTCEKVTEAGYATCKIIPVDTLMYVCRGSIGVMAINKIECATNQSICRAKCHDNVCNVEFLYHALMYQKDNIKKMGTGTSFKSLNQTSFSELKIELPPYNEQMKFVSIAQQADKSEYYN